MGHLDSKGDLSIAQLAFFVPALLVALFVFVRHGLFRQRTWFYLVTLAVLRIIGASCVIYAETQDDTSKGLQEAAAITDAIGTAPLLLSLLGMLERINQTMTPSAALPTMAFRILNILPVIGLVLAIVGEIKEPTDPVVVAAGHSTGQHLTEGATIVFLVVLLALAGLVVVLHTRKEHIPNGDRKLIYAGLASLPFLLVRVIYSILVSFDVSSDFFYRDVNVYIEAFMQFLMEAIVVTMFIIVGLMVPRMGAQATPATRDAQMESIGNGQSRPQAYQQSHAYESVHAHAPPQSYDEPMKQREQRNLNDYRPSRMIRNAIRNR